MDSWRAWLEDSTLADVAGLDNAEDLIDDLGDLGEDGSDGELGMDSTLAEVMDYAVDSDPPVNSTGPEPPADI